MFRDDLSILTLPPRDKVVSDGYADRGNVPGTEKGRDIRVRTEDRVSSTGTGLGEGVVVLLEIGPTGQTIDKEKDTVRGRKELENFYRGGRCVCTCPPHLSELRPLVYPSAPSFSTISFHYPQDETVNLLTTEVAL